MYSPAQTQKFQQETRSWLSKAAAGTLSAKDLAGLRNTLRFHEHRYYVLDDPLIADKEYDNLYKALGKIEAEHPDKITADSPTQRVARGLTRDFPTVQHLVPMLSLENSYNAEDLKDWDRKAREATGLDRIDYCVEPKFDGASISLIYENDLLVRGATRGDGVEGDDVTANIRQIRSVPLSAAFSKYGFEQVELRGEILMSRKNFKRYNDALAEQNLPPLANPRNAASGSLRIKDPAEVSRRNLEAFLYQLSYFTTLKKNTAGPETHSETLNMLHALGFRAPQKEKKVLRGIDAVIGYCSDFETGRDDLPYEIDGMVIKVNDLALQDRMGMTTHHPRWAIAFKFRARQATSTLQKVEFQVGRTGNITPVAKIDPVPIGGVTVTSVSLFNEDVVTAKDLRIGDQVLVERAGDVIPYIVKPLTELRKGKEKKIVFPDKCPVCHDKLVREAGEAAWRCVNINCPAQVVERIIHFASKDAMDIRSFGAANVQKFHDLGFLNDVPGIYQLPFEKIADLEGFGEKSITNLREAIEKSKSQPLHRLIFGLGIRFVGETTAKTLAAAVTYLPDFAKMTAEELQELDDIGPKVAASVHQFFSNPDNTKMIARLEKAGLNVRSTRSERRHEGNLTGQSFLFTGTLQQLKRSEAEEMVEARGGNILSGVSSKLNYLVVGEDAGSKLEKARKIPAIRILSEAEFLQFIQS